MNIGELFIALGFDVDDKKLKEFNENIKSGMTELLKMSAVAAGAVYAMNAFVEGGIRSATALRNFNAETGNSIEGLQKWQVAAVLTNAAISADEVTASFQAMSQAIADVTMGKGPSGAFAMLGVSDVRGRDPADVLEELRLNFNENVKKWGLPQTVNLMKEVGFDKGMLQALQLTRYEFDELAGSKFLDQETRDRLIDLGNAMSRFKLEWKLYKDQISADLAPGLIQFIDNVIPKLKDFGDSVKAVKDALVSFWGQLSPAAQDALKTFASILVVAYAPVTSMFVLLAAAVWDLGHALRNLPSISGKGLLWLLNLMQSEDGSPIAELKKRLAAANDADAKNIVKPGAMTGRDVTADEPFTRAPADFLTESDLWRFTQGLTTPNRMTEQMIAQQQANFNNVYHINSVQDAFEIADEITGYQQQQLNKSFSQFNNGPKY